VAWKRLDADVARGLAGWAGLACVAIVGLLGWLHFAQAGHVPAAARPAPARRPVALPAGQAVAWESFPSYRGVVPVVMYHSIGGRPSYLTTSRAQFAQQMRALQLGGFHPLTISQYAAYVRGDAAGLPVRPILLTFDDGRQDAYLAANGILRSYGFHATDLAVPGWVTGHPGFSVSWAEIAQMSHGTTWNVESHFGYGPEKVRISRTGATGARLGYLQYLPAVPARRGHPGHPGHLETFARFRKQFTGNELWGIHQFQQHLPGFRPLATAIPGSNYGQAGTNDPLIPPYVLSWLDHHFAVVFGGDYLNQAKGRPFQIPGRFSPRLSYRMSMGPQVTLAVLRCRLLDFVRGVPIAWERRCLRPARPASAASGSGARPSATPGAPSPGAAAHRIRPARTGRHS
jgi:hypothetical protein